MAGSRKWMVYTTDSGTEVAVNIDESNGERTGFQDFAEGDTFPVLENASRIMRYANTVNIADADIRRKFYIGDLATYTGFADGGVIDTANSENFRVTSLRGERRRVPFANDTAQDDGDDT